MSEILTRMQRAMAHFPTERIPAQGAEFSVPSLEGISKPMEKSEPDKKVLETLWEIAREVAENGITLTADDDGLGEYCIFCGTYQYGKSSNYDHTSDCIVTKARALVKGE